MFFKLDYRFEDSDYVVKGLIGHDSRIYWIAKDIGSVLDYANPNSFATRKARRAVLHQVIGNTFPLGKRLLNSKVFEQDELLIELNRITSPQSEAFSNTISSTETRVLPINGHNYNIYPSMHPSYDIDYAPIIQVSRRLENDSQKLLEWLKDYTTAVAKHVYHCYVPDESPPESFRPTRKRKNGRTYSTPVTAPDEVTSTSDEMPADVYIRDRSPSSMPRFIFEMEEFPPERIRLIADGVARVYDRISDEEI